MRLGVAALIALLLSSVVLAQAKYPALDQEPACQTLTPAAAGGPLPQNPDVVVFRFLGVSNYEMAYRDQVVLLDAAIDELAWWQPTGLKPADMTKHLNAVFVGHAHGEHVWDALLASGGVRPFGLEPQRVLRLQKQHIIVGQDTDSESDPYAAGMPWAVKLDKPENFIGRWALEEAAEREPAERLVGFIVDDGVVPTEGAAVVAGETPVGMVWWARRSPQLGCVIGMAWVPPSAAEDGASVTISDAGRRLGARIVTEPFYDPKGAVLRS